MNKQIKTINDLLTKLLTKELTVKEKTKLIEAWEHVRFDVPTDDEIHIVWGIEDVQNVLEEYFDVPTDTLTDLECRKVLESVRKNHDANEGIKWETLQYHVESLYGNKIEEAQ